MIVQTVNVYKFREEFYMEGRKGSFTYEGMKVLFDWLEELSETTVEPIELDVVSLCGEYAEDSLEEIALKYGLNTKEKNLREYIREYLEEETIVCGDTREGFVYGQF
jgi:hypothetical protein